jgi:hypothetical protein
MGKQIFVARMMAIHKDFSLKGSIVFLEYI